MIMSSVQTEYIIGGGKWLYIPGVKWLYPRSKIMLSLGNIIISLKQNEFIFWAKWFYPRGKIILFSEQNEYIIGVKRTLKYISCIGSYF